MLEANEMKLVRKTLGKLDRIRSQQIRKSRGIQPINEWVERRRRRTKLLDDLRNRKRYWDLKKEAEDRRRWKRQFINQT